MRTTWKLGCDMSVVNSAKLNQAHDTLNYLSQQVEKG